MEILFWLLLFAIFHTFIGYPITLWILSKILKKKVSNKSSDYNPQISFIIAAHNEEKSIIEKLKNVMNLEYDLEKFQVIIASDNSSDKTNLLVEDFIRINNLKNFKLYTVKERKGKTNAQNEAVKISTGDILVFSDANSIWGRNSIKQLVTNFYDKNIAYVCGRLEYVNSFENITSNAENTYWNYDLKMRKKESELSSITAGNGAIYAIRKEDYIEIDPMECHDGSFPTLAILNDKRAIYEEKAIAYEKAGENTEDEFSRKVRMGRGILRSQYGNFSKYNFFKYGLYSYFYFCHRYLRYSLWTNHILIYLINIFLIKENHLYLAIFILQNAFYILALIGYKSNSKMKVFYFPYYYLITIFSQMIAIKKNVFRENRPFWEKAESTR